MKWQKFFCWIVTFYAFFISSAHSEEITLVTGSWFENEFISSVEEEFNFNILDNFEKETGIKVNVEGYPFRELFQVIEVRMQAKDSKTDVLFVDSPLSASYAVRGFTKPIDSLFSPEELQNFYPSTVAIATWENQVQNVPLQNSSQVMYINRTLFEKAGVTPPTMDVMNRWTWKEVVDAARKIQSALKQDNDEVWGLLFDQVSRPYQMLALPQSLGAGSGVSPDGLKINGFLNNDGWVKALQWWHDTHNTWNISPKGVQPNETEALFLTGNIAMYVGGTWHIPAFSKARQEGKLDFDIVPHPYFKAGKPVTGTNSWHLAISPYSKKQDAATKFIKYMTSAKMGAMFFKANGQLIANKIMGETIESIDKYKMFPWNSYKQIVAYELQNTAMPRPSTPFYLEWEDAVAKAWEDVRNGASPKKTLDKYVRILERTARKYR